MAAIKILPILRLKQQHRFNIFHNIIVFVFVNYFPFLLYIGYSQRVFAEYNMVILLSHITFDIYVLVNIE